MNSFAGSNSTVASSSIRSDSAASDCSQVATIAIQLTVLVMKFPSSPDILVISGQISGASSVTCSVDEKESLISLEKPFEEAITHINEALESVQQQLMMLTGSTASTENILTSAASTETIVTTTASENILSTAFSTEDILTDTVSTENISNTAASTENILSNTASTNTVLIENISNTTVLTENILATTASTEILNIGGGIEGDDHETGTYR